MTGDKVTKKILFISRQAPYGQSTAKECLDAILAASAYEQDLSLLFMGDGVFQLKKHQDTGESQQKNLANIFPVLGLYDIDKIYTQESALKERGLQQDDLVVTTTPLNNEAIQTLMEQQDQLLSF